MLLRSGELHPGFAGLNKGHWNSSEEEWNLIEHLLSNIEEASE